ncbi:MAG: hypothetical protein ACUVUG_01885 [Candidatus Aminicenantia bacterium]
MQSAKVVIEENDLKWIKSLVKQQGVPLSIEEIALQLARKKSALTEGKKVKVFNPEIDYEIGDLIYKYYDEDLKFSREKVIHFKGGVVLRAIGKEKRPEGFSILRVTYDGTGLFKHYIDFLERTSSSLLLPCGFSGKSEPVEYLEDEESLMDAPLDKNYVKRLAKNIENALKKSNEFIQWNSYFYLRELLENVEDAGKKVEAYLKEKGDFETTINLVEKIYSVKFTDERFYSWCLSLNCALETKGKGKIVKISNHEWGKWGLRSFFSSLKENLPVTEKPLKIEALRRNKKDVAMAIWRFHAEERKEKTQNLRFYLTWREIFSGALRIYKEYEGVFNEEREIILIDQEKKISYKAFYFPEDGFLLGLREIYQTYSPIQGSIFFLQKEDYNKFIFSFRKAKKAITAFKCEYDNTQKKIIFTGQPVETHTEINKAILIARDELAKISSLYEEASRFENLNELLHFVFMNFGNPQESYKIYLLKAYYIADMFANVKKEDFETVIFGNPEFFSSEEEKGYFYLDITKIGKEEEIEEGVKVEQEMREEQAEEITEEVMEEFPVEALEPQEQKVSVKEEMEVISTEDKESKYSVEKEPILTPAPEIEIYRKFKEEIKKTKGKGKKGAKKIIEEKIKLEESEREAEIYIKESVEEIETKEKEEKEDVVKPAVKEKPKIGVFGAKLSKVLSDKKEDKK